MGEHGKFSAVVVACMDGRLVRANRIWQEYLFGSTDLFDVIQVAGGIREVVYRHRGSVLEGLRVSIELHGVRWVVLQAHEDCGAYGGSASFTSTDERGFHLGQMVEAAGIIQEHFSGAELFIEMYYARRNDEGTWIFEKVG
ncbi:MAG: carbonic anhydrase [Candidatus Uhrbacteria bacterium]